MKLLYLLLIFPNFDFATFRILAEETRLKNSLTPRETNAGIFPSAKTPLIDFRIQNIKRNYFEGGTLAEIILTNRNIGEPILQKTTTITPSREWSIAAINSTRETSTKVGISNFTPEMAFISTTAAFTINEIPNPASKTTFNQQTTSSRTALKTKNLSQISSTLNYHKPTEKVTSDSTPKTIYSQQTIARTAIAPENSTKFTAQRISSFDQILETISPTQITHVLQKSVANMSSTRETPEKFISSQHPTSEFTPESKFSTLAFENSTNFSAQKIASFNHDKFVKHINSDSTPKVIFSQETNTATTIALEISTKYFAREINTFKQTSEILQLTTEVLQALKPTANVTFPRENSTKLISSLHSTLELTQAPILPTEISKIIQTTRAILPTENCSAKITSTSEISAKHVSNQNITSIIANLTTRIIKPHNTTRKFTDKTRSKKKQKSSKVTPQPTSPKAKTKFSRQSRAYSEYPWTGSRTDPTFKEIDYRESNEFGEESFKKFMIRTPVYVDKSLLIKEFLEHARQVILLTRPRFWGKSLNLNMLRKFFEIEVDLRGNILSEERQTNRRIFCGGNIYNESALKTFRPLKIANIREAMEHQGKHPVIQLNYNFIRNGSYDEMKMGMKMEIIRSFKKHFYLESYYKLNPQLLDHYQRSQFERYRSGNLTTQDLIKSIQFLTELLSKYFNQTVFVLIDEYDAPLIEAFRQSFEDPENLENMLHFYRLMYTSAFKNNPFLAKAFITGKLRIENSHLFNNLKDMVEYTLLDNELNDFYGFTESEVDALLKLAPNETSKEIKEFYRGYNYGGQIMYNPWSIKQCIENNYTLRAYWLQTGILLPANRPKYSLEGVQQDIKSLLGGGCVQIPIKNEITFDGLENGKNFFNFILFTGYLSPAAKNPNGTYQLVKPNKEANFFYKLLLGTWIQQHFETFGLWGVTIPTADQSNCTSATSTTNLNIPRATKKSRFGLTLGDSNSIPRFHSNFTHNVSHSLEKYNVVPHVIPVAPRNLVRVFFTTGELKPGAVLNNDDAYDQPTLHWDADENSYYTLYLITYQHKENYSLPKPGERIRYPYRPQWHNWIVVNIPGNNISMGEVLYDYVAPRNPTAYADSTNYNSFLIYKQAKGITKFEPWRGNENDGFLQYTPLIDFAANYSLGNPEFGNFFIIESNRQILTANANCRF